MADYKSVAAAKARKYGLNPRLFVRQIGAESGFNPNARSPAGALGIAQFMPQTAKGMGVDPLKPEQALDGAARLMSGYVKKYGSYRNALVAYNAGPARVGKPLYGETAAYISRIIGGSGDGGGLTKPAPETSSSGYGATTKKVTVPGIDRSSARKSLVANYFQQSGNPDALIGLALGLKETRDTPATQKTITVPGTKPKAGKGGKVPSVSGTATFEGTTVAGWIAPILKYARKHGWQGSVRSGFRTLADQTRIYNSGVRPAAKPGTSNHEGAEFPRGAVDVTDAQALANIINRSQYRGALVWAGSKDPVHFSHPHNGSY